MGRHKAVVDVVWPHPERWERIGDQKELPNTRRLVNWGFNPPEGAVEGRWYCLPPLSLFRPGYWRHEKRAEELVAMLKREAAQGIYRPRAEVEPACTNMGVTPPKGYFGVEGTPALCNAKRPGSLKALRKGCSGRRRGTPAPVIPIPAPEPVPAPPALPAAAKVAEATTTVAKAMASPVAPPGGDFSALLPGKLRVVAEVAAIRAAVRRRVDLDLSMEHVYETMAAMLCGQD